MKRCTVWSVNSVKVRLLPRSGCVWLSSSMAVKVDCCLAEMRNNKISPRAMWECGGMDAGEKKGFDRDE